jgi:pimeloyl-ACP methyl ester carboxylesterase
VLRSFSQGALFGAVTGTEPVRVVGLHGWARTHRDFDGVLRGLDAVAFDLPGFGASPPPSAAIGASGYADVLLRALEECGDEPITLVGHSFGGRVAVCAAARSPERFRRLVLTGVPLLHRAGPRPRAATSFRLLRALHRARFVSSDRMEAARQRYGSDDYRNARGVMRDVLVRLVNEEYPDELAKVQCHVDLVWGAADDVAPVEIAHRASGMLRDAAVEELPGVGHFVPLDAAERLRAAIDRA